MKIVFFLLVVILIDGVLLEIGLRVFFGFGDPLLYVADQQIGYRLAPNQRVRRFGNRIQINHYSMRSADIPIERPEQILRVLLLGDSIANGGWWTDQSEILSELISRKLTAQFIHDYERVEVLNASANSWGPRNELAYLMRFGNFNAQIVVLLINTDDLFATAPTSIQVGRDRSYPNRKPMLAITEVLTRYLIKPKPIPELEAVKNESGDRVGVNLEAIRQIKKNLPATNHHLLVAMTPLLREVRTPGPRDYELAARRRLTEFTQLAQIPYLNFLPLFKRFDQPEDLYRDHIHLSPEGNLFVSDLISGKIEQLLTNMNQAKTSTRNEMSNYENVPADLWKDVIEDPWK